jgi:hypothetical protein
MAHELVSHDRHPLARLQHYCHIDEALDTNSTQRKTQTSRVNLDRRRYGSAMQTPETTHGTLDHGGSICGLQKKSEGSARVQTRSTNPTLTAVRAQWNSGLCYLGGIAGAGAYLEYHTEVWQQRSDSRFSCPRKRVIGPPSRGKLLLSLSGL